MSHVNNQEVTQLFLDDELICNGLLFVDFEENPIQLYVCEECYIHGCSSSNWIGIKKVNQSLLFIPPFTEMLNDNHGCVCSYPYYMRKKGIVFLKDKVLMELCDRIPFFNKKEHFDNLTYFNIKLSLQLEAPYMCLGNTFEPVKFNHNLFLSTNDKHGRNILKILKNTLENTFFDEQPINLIKQYGGDEIIIYLDNHELTEFKPLYKINNEYHLRLEPGYLVKSIEE